MEDSLQFKAMSSQLTVDEAQGIVECFVAAIGNKDSVGDIVIPGAFNASLRRRKPRVVWGHDWNQPIGKVLEIYEVGPNDPRLPSKMKQAGVGGLWARVQFNLKSERGREAFANIVFFGEDQEWSIGYKTLDSIYSPERQANILKEVELYEVSPVLHGANQLTGTISIKSDQQKDNTVTSFRESKWETFDPSFAEMIKEKYPSIWAKGGNIRGNSQFAKLLPIYRSGGTAKTQSDINALELREAWVARHRGDFRLPGVVAQIKWLAVGSRGEAYMKGVIREEIAKLEAKKKDDDFDVDIKGDIHYANYTGFAEPEEDEREEFGELIKYLMNKWSDVLDALDDEDGTEEEEYGERRNPEGKSCPIATRDVAVNLRNRQKAIETAAYGPLNPDEPNKAFWTKKAERWDVSPSDARKQTCGNCAAFVKTKRMLGCIESGLGNEADNDAIDVIKAGDLGYCEAFDFKCASKRTCDAWITGGPVTDESSVTDSGDDESGGMRAAAGKGMRVVGQMSSSVQQMGTEIPAAQAMSSDSEDDEEMPEPQPKSVKVKFPDGTRARIQEDGTGIISDPNGEQFEIGSEEKGYSDPYENVPPRLMKKAQAARMAALEKMNMGKKADQEVKAPAPGSETIGNLVSALGDRLPNPSNFAPDALPQERVTGDVLRGYGPRRGNLERLLRYWRPIMRKPGGFRRCRVILADHPELYPLDNLCAWLHHETTGLWPNEGCHHPGMKNCRRKLRGVVRGSLLSDSEFDNRLRRLGGKKSDEKSMWGDYEKGGQSLPPLAEPEQKYVESMLEIVSEYGKLADNDGKGIWVGYESAEMNDDAMRGISCSNCAFYRGEENCSIVAQPIEPGGKCRLAAIAMPPGGKGMWSDEDVTDEDIEFANKVLDWFVKEEMDFVKMISNDDNWDLEGEDDDGKMMSMPWDRSVMAPVAMAKPGGCGCGCGGGGMQSPRPKPVLMVSLPKSISESLAGLEEKVGRVLNARNTEKISQAISLLTEVIGGEPTVTIERKEGDVVLKADSTDLLELHAILSPVVDYHALDSEFDEDGMLIKGVSDDAYEAISNAIEAFDHIETKSTSN